MAMSKYNTGGSTSGHGIQLNDYHYSKMAVTVAKAKKTFSFILGQFTQPKHFGETVKFYKDFPIMHELNVNGQGIDADGVEMLQGKWYAWDEAGVRTEHADKAAAKASAGQVRIMSGDGNLGGSDRDWLVQNGSIPALNGEEGGVVNGVGMKRQLIIGKLKEFGITHRFTKKELDLDTEVNLLTKKTKKIAEAYADVRERQVRNGLISAGMVNATYTGIATSIAECTNTSVLTYRTLRLLENSLDLALVPQDTKVLTGSTKIDTKTLPASRFIFIPYELKATIEDMVDGNGKPKFKEVNEYTDSMSTPVEGEFGAIGRFRFITVHDMPLWEGEGADVVDDNAEDLHTFGGKYTVFPMLFVGSDAVKSMNLSGEVAKVSTVLPKADAHNDNFGKVGSVAIAWYFSLIVMHPERVRVIFTCAKQG